MTALRARVVAGNPPTAVQLKGPGIQEWAAQGALNDVEDVATAENWEAVLPPVLAEIMKYQGKYVAAHRDQEAASAAWQDDPLRHP